MINGQVLKDSETAKWEYTINMGSPLGNEEVKIVRELEYRFETEKEAEEELQVEFDKLLNQLKI